MRHSSALLSHQGHVRARNEDSCTGVPEAGLWVVTDGMGGHADGHVASRLATETIVQAIGTGQSLPNAIARAQARLLEAMSNGEGEHGMGTTVVVLQIKGSAFELAWVGDSRAYLLRDGLRPLTRDHSLVQEWMEAGLLTPEQARVDPRRNIITRALGLDDPTQTLPEAIFGELQAGDALLLCTDGLSNELDDTTIEALLGEAGTEEQRVQRLVDAALKAGGRDNITVALIQMEG
ncbi:MAG: serine/threonine-protein phosphatase [Chromatiales bacterium]|nr:serine/threonine-protein phosphatase [Chromatiales bacterium]